MHNGGAGTARTLCGKLTNSGGGRLNQDSGYSWGASYATPAEPLQILHERLLNKYNVSPDTASNRLDRLVGKMRPLGPEALYIQKTYVLLGMPPGELFEGHPIYWSGVEIYGNYILIKKSGGCQRHVTALKNRRWKISRNFMPEFGSLWRLQILLQNLKWCESRQVCKFDQRHRCVLEDERPQ